MNADLPLAVVHVVCGVVLEKDGKYLLVQERQPKAYGLWNLPGGRVDKGESLEQAAIREAKEETGYDVRLIKHIFVLHTAIDQPVLHVYKAAIIGGELSFPPEEMLDARWFTYEEIIAMDPQLRNPDYIVGAIKAAQK